MGQTQNRKAGHIEVIHEEERRGRGRGNMGFRKGSNSLPRALGKASRGGGIELGPGLFQGWGSSMQLQGGPRTPPRCPGKRGSWAGVDQRARGEGSGQKVKASLGLGRKKMPSVECVPI